MFIYILLYAGWQKQIKVRMLGNRRIHAAERPAHGFQACPLAVAGAEQTPQERTVLA
jgi:hypothetical protein